MYHDSWSVLSPCILICIHLVMKKWVGMPPDPPEDIDSGEPISESCSLDGPVGLLSLQDDSVPQRTPHTSVEGEQHPNEQFQSQPYRHHFTQRDSSTPKLMVGSHRATVLDNTPTRHTTMTPLFNEVQHNICTYICTYVRMCIRMYVYMCTCTYACM